MLSPTSIIYQTICNLMVRLEKKIHITDFNIKYGIFVKIKKTFVQEKKVKIIS